MRRCVAIVMLAGALAACASVLGTAGAGAQTSTAPLSCDFVVEPPALAPGGGTVTVTGFAPGTSVVQIFFDPVGPQGPFIIVPNVPTSPTDGFFTTTFFTSVSGEVTVGVDNYPGLVCTGAAGASVGAAGASRGQLPRTGSSHTSTTILFGLAAVALGSVLVVAARRRDTIRQRG